MSELGPGPNRIKSIRLGRFGLVEQFHVCVGVDSQQQVFHAIEHLNGQVGNTPFISVQPIETKIVDTQFERVKLDFHP